jgi:AcrR family transcriptional regulator
MTARTGNAVAGSGNGRGQTAPRRRSSRAALVEAALEEFTERGYEAATVTDVARRAGVTTGALYAHFDGKLDLLLQALGLTPANQLLQQLATLARLESTDVIRLVSEVMSAEPERASLLLLDAIVAARRDEQVAQALRAGVEAYERAVRQAAEAGTELGLLDPALPPADLARVFGLLSIGRIVMAALDASSPSAEAYDRLVELLLQASGATAEDGTSPALAKVRSRAQVLERARDGLAESIAAANAAGHSLREVGAAAGVSHERVRQLLRRQRP